MKTKKIAKGFMVGIVLAAATFFAIGFVFLYLLFFGPPGKTIEDVARYEEIFGERGIQTGYITFPLNIPKGAKETEFYHYYRDTFNTPTVQTYLQCVYDEATYQEEIRRLENTVKTYGNRKVKLLRDEKKKFQYPAYIAIENAGYSYEYALLTGKCEITYIYTSFVYEDSVKFSKEYLPYDFMTDEDREFGSGYSIYYSKITSSAISADYSRDRVTEVTDAYMRMVGDNSFHVFVRLDEKGRQIITGCEYFICKDLYDEGEVIEYHDIDGFEYKDMEVNHDTGEIIVAYFDNGEEKTMCYSLFVQENEEGNK